MSEFGCLVLLSLCGSLSVSGSVCRVSVSDCGSEALCVYASVTVCV